MITSFARMVFGWAYASTPWADCSSSLGRDVFGALFVAVVAHIPDQADEVTVAVVLHDKGMRELWFCLRPALSLPPPIQQLSTMECGDRARLLVSCDILFVEDECYWEISYLNTQCKARSDNVIG